MSTRRARIKAVAALPPRRKNAESTDSKPNPPKETPEKPLKSPRTPRNLSSKSQEEKSSPAVKCARTPPALLSITSTKTPITKLSIPSPKSGTSVENVIDTALSRSERVPIVTALPNTEDVFASPSPKIGTDKKPVVSRVAGTSKVDDSKSSKICEKQSSKKDEKAKVKKKCEVSDDYSIPSVPESVTNEDVMDGIVPLQTADDTPKPIDMLMNEIISENAEALFDPIVPLPSPNKVRLKLRPAPRLGPQRRNSVQGSASESEDESRRAMMSSGTATPAPLRLRCDSYTSHSTLHSIPNREANRMRNDSVSSSVSQATVQPPPTASPMKEKHLSKMARRQEMGKRMWRRRRDTVKPDALTMYDLIFYNPTTNPIVPDKDELEAKEANAKEEAERIAKTHESEEDADDPPLPDDAAPVPQIKLGPNGEIILDEKSLVIKQSDAKRKVSSVVREGAWGGFGGRYTRSARTAEWTPPETVRFYRALGAVGTDFTLMAQLFPGRTRRDLKLKFKKEEKLNGAQVDMALRSATSWDVTRLQCEFQEERADAIAKAKAQRAKLIEDKKAERERLRVAKELKVRSSRGFKALESTACRAIVHSELTADAFVKRAMATRSRAKAMTESEGKSDDPLSTLPQFATLTLLNTATQSQPSKSTTSDMATLSRVDTKPTIPTELNAISTMPPNIETGSLVVLRVNDPKAPTKTMLQTYIAHGAGKLTPVALPSTFLNSVVGYMNMGTPKSTKSSSPQVASPSSVASAESRKSSTPTVIQLNPSPAKRKRHSSYTITAL